MFKTTEQLREEFDQVARRFDQDEAGVPNKHIKRTFKSAGIKEYLSKQLPARGELALEVGTGLGNFTSRLAEHFARVITLDLSPEMIRVAQKNNNEFTNIEFIVADVNTWDIPAGQFDCVISITTLHHMPLEPVLQKLKDTLKPGGILLIGDFYTDTGSLKNMKRLFTKITKIIWKMRRSILQKGPVARSGMGHDRNEPYLAIDEVHRVCDSLLPKARVKRLSGLYAIVWKKP
jgi:ubiquinone/menaquinone biosynthesis C-methylase UbiE